MPAIPISRIEIDTSVHTVPLHERHRRIEIARDSLHFLCSQIHNECLGIKVIGYGMFTAILANASESRRTARHQKLLPIRRVRSTSQISIPGDQRICLQGGQINLEKRREGERASSDVRLGSAAQQFLAIRGNIIQIDVVTTVGQTLGKARRHIVFHEIIAVTRIGDTVVRMQETFQRTTHLFALVREHIDKIVFCRRPAEISFGNILQQHFLTHRGGIEHNQVILLLAHNRIIELVAVGHPVHLFIGIGQYHPAGLYLGQLTTGPGTLHVVIVRIAGQQILAVGRKRNPARSGAEIGVEQRETSLHVRCHPAGYIGKVLFLFKFAFQHRLHLVVRA